MSQKNEKKKQIRLKQVSEELSALANDLANGKLRIGNTLISIGEPLFFKTKQKVKDDRAYFTLSFQVPLTESAGEDSTTINENPEPLPKKEKTSFTRTVLPKEGAPPSAKKIKKDIGRLWKNVAKNIEANQTPLQTDIKSLISKCEDYTMYAKYPWQDAWTTCYKAVENCSKAATNGDFDTAKTLIMEVNRLTKVCHKKYK